MDWIIDKFKLSLNDLSKNTQKQYLTVVMQFVEYLPDGESITKDLVNVFISKHNNASYRGGIKKYLRFLNSSGILSSDKMLAILDAFPPHPKPKKRSAETIPTKDDLLRACAYADSPKHSIFNEELIRLRDRALFFFLLCTGTRVTAACNVQYKDVNWKDRIVNTVEKNNKPHQVFVPSDAWTPLEKYLQERVERFGKGGPEAPLFMRHDKRAEHNSPISSRTADNIMIAIKNGAGLECSFSPHILRHVYATNLFEISKEDKYLVGKALGHSPSNTTDLYIHSSGMMTGPQILEQLAKLNNKLSAVKG